jgi:hypothetical protein
MDLACSNTDLMITIYFPFHPRRQCRASRHLLSLTRFTDLSLSVGLCVCVCVRVCMRVAQWYVALVILGGKKHWQMALGEIRNSHCTSVDRTHTNTHTPASLSTFLSLRPLPSLPTLHICRVCTPDSWTSAPFSRHSLLFSLSLHTRISQHLHLYLSLSSIV